MNNNPFKKDELPEPKPSVQATQAEKSPAPTVILSHVDAYIHERVKAQPKTRQEIDVKLEEKVNPEHHRLTLPYELDEFKKKYAFHWILKSPRGISEACDIKGWVLVNKTHFPELPNHLFSVTGSIERGDLILGFMKLEKAERYRREVGELSTEKVKGMQGAHRGKPGYYVPSDTSEEGEKSQVIGI